jgi:hypothetical protein
MHVLRQHLRYEDLSKGNIYELVFEPFYLEMEAEWEGPESGGQR